MIDYKEYELIFLIPNVEMEEINSIREKVKQLIKKYGGEVIRESEPQKRKLAYIIKGNKAGVYNILRLNLKRKDANELSKKIKFLDGILRHLLIDTVILPTAKKEEGEEKEMKQTEKKEPKVEKIEEIKKMEEKKEKIEEKEEQKIEKSKEKVKKEAIEENVTKEETEVKKEKKKKKSKIKIDELNKKIDDILKDDDIKY